MFQFHGSKSFRGKWLFHQTSISNGLFGVPGTCTIEGREATQEHSAALARELTHWGIEPRVRPWWPCGGTALCILAHTRFQRKLRSDDGWWWMMMDDDGWWWMMMDGIRVLSLFCTHFRSRCNHPLCLTPLLQWWSDRWGCVLGINTSTPAWRDQDDTEIPWDTPKAATC